MPVQTPVLLQDWLPFEAVGAESKRERGASSALPPLYFLHVWWARRPLAASRAAIVASVLPDYDTLSANPKLRQHFPTRERYEGWVVRLLGILGDPVAARKLIQADKEGKIKLTENPYSHARAFTVNPTEEDLHLMREILRETWGTDRLTVLDPFSGGGSIPFEARRYGFDVIANELNPVGAVILKATLDYPFRFGESLRADIKKWGDEWARRVQKRLSPFFPKQRDENIQAYLWARTIDCPTTGKPVPLSPNWWLSKSPKIAAKLIVRDECDAPRFEIRRGKEIDFDPNEGTIARGNARSPWTGDTIDGEYIKQEAQAGRMGQVLYAVAVKRRGGFDFRAPSDDDLTAVAHAEAELARLRPQWEAADLIPTEPFPEGNDNRPLTYGMPTWSDFFAPRQLLAIGTFASTLREMEPEIRNAIDEERAEALITYMAFVVDKAADRNSVQTRWIPQRLVIANTFDRHDFAMKWTYAEFDAAGNLLPWGMSQIEDAYRGLVKLTPEKAARLNGQSTSCGNITLHQGSAYDLSRIPDDSVHVVVTDPPYYDNVMYAELADFFYVWLKRTVGPLYPEWFSAALTNKDDEAVANPARFADLGRKKSEMADRDYERKMAAAFREMHRVLCPEGVLTVMFTHKRVEAWDTLATALIRSGFTIESSWPVHTEFEHSLHQAKKNAAASTILLACRKRAEAGEPVWWDDIQGEVRRTAREAAKRFVQQGITGVDVYIATFGPVLSVISRNWPVLTSEVDERTGEPKPLRPETALELAREEVVRLRKQGLLHGREVQFDPVTDWYLMAWDAFQAAAFPADEARKLAIALGLNVENDLVGNRVLRKKSKDVELLEPKERRSKQGVNPDHNAFATTLDAVHTALLVYQEDGGAACETFLKRAGLRQNSTFKAAVEALLHAIPRTKKDGAFIRPEAEGLEALRTAFFPDIEAPVDPVLEHAEQLGMFDDEDEE